MASVPPIRTCTRLTCLVLVQVVKAPFYAASGSAGPTPPGLDRSLQFACYGHLARRPGEGTMRKLGIGVALAVGGLASAIWVPAAHAASPGVTVPSACVVVNAPGGLAVQAGYAPDGPGGCQQLP